MKFDALGVYPANVTARGSDGNVDIPRTKAVVEFLYSRGVDGLHICGTTGEFATLNVEQRQAVADACIEAAAGKGTLIVQVGAVATADSCALARHAAQAGAHAISSVPPFYYPVTEAIVLNHYRRIAEASGLPVIIYDNPRTTGFTVTVELAQQLAEEGAVHGIKLARQDMYSLARFSEINQSTFVVYPVETFYLAGLVTAPHAGTIGSMGNWIPEVFVGIKRNYEAGNLQRAAELQRLACNLITAYQYEEISCTKALMEYRNVPVGEPWEPLLPMPAEEKQALFRRMDAFNLNFDGMLEVDVPHAASA